MRIGFIGPLWPPHHGGASLYESRLAQALIDRGEEVRVFTATPEIPGRDNGTVPAVRWDGGPLSRIISAANADNGPPPALFDHYAFMAAAAAWAKAEALDIALIGIIYQEAPQLHARELYRQLQAMGIRVGAFHYDLSIPVQQVLSGEYGRRGNWQEAGDAVVAELRRICDRPNPLEAYARIGSPLVFEPDFTISCSRWSDRFIDPLNRLPRYVLRPFLDAEYWRTPPPANDALDHRDVLMVNPQSRKGPRQMCDLVAGGRPEWTYRFLKGGWGDAFAVVRPHLQGLPAFQQGRVDMLDYVPDIRSAYQASGLLFFPSLVEGYGMTAVEPMFAGIPVVASTYPAVIEAVGDGALSLCPYRAPPQAWLEAVNHVLGAPAPWRARALARAQRLEQRQQAELDGLIRFMASL